MLIKDDRTPATGSWFVPVNVLVGVVVGVLLCYAWFKMGSGPDLPEILEGPFAERTQTAEALPPSPLEQIRITVTEDDARILQAVRD